MIHEQMSIENNVTLAIRDEAFNIIETHHKRNRVTNLALYGIAKLIFGSFTNINEISDYIPKYIAFGTGGDTPSPTETSLKAEITDSENNPVRIPITQKNIVNTNLTDGVVKVVYRAYTASTVFAGVTLNEMGLFVEDTGNNLFARVGLESIVTERGKVLDILWEINIRSTTTGGVSEEETEQDGEQE